MNRAARGSRIRRLGPLALGLGALLPIAAGAEAGRHDSSDAAYPDYFVSPSGDDASSGADWRRPLRSIQRALELARPGERISVAAGNYLEDIRSVRAGRPGAPIVLEGAAGATIRGAGRSRVIEVNHGHLVLSNLAVDGEVTDAGGRVTYRDKLVYIMGTDEARGVTGVRLLNLRLRNAGGECIRLKYFAHHNELAYSTVRRCGVEDFELGGNGKNGEAVYIGTAPEQLDRNPSPAPDRSDGNWIHHNHFDTRANECVDIKEAARSNVIEHNACTGQLDEHAAGISSRGNRNVIRFNRIWGNRGAGIRFGGDTDDDGIENEAYGNTLFDNAYAPFKIMARPQARVCGNVVEDAPRRLVRGREAAHFDPLTACGETRRPRP